MKSGTKGASAPVWPLQSQAMQFYGDPRQSGWLAAYTTRVTCPWPLYVGGKPMSSGVLIHKKCAESLARVFAAIWDAVGGDVQKIHALRYDVFDGSYNFRAKRGSSSLSMHSYACALDFDAEDNAFHSVKHLYTEDSIIVRCFEAERWVWGGRWSVNSVDAMHFQAARVHP